MRIQRVALVGGAILLVVLLAVVETTGRASGLGLFVGRFHPTIVHFPIVLLLMFVGVEFANWRGWFAGSAMTKASSALLYTGAWFAILAAGVGLYLAQGGGYDFDTLMWHKRLGVVLALGATVAYLLRTRDPAANPPARSPAHVVFAALVAVVVVVAGHLGATMTHGEGFLTRYMPGLQPATGSIVRIADPATATIFESFIRPALDDKCVGCHNARLSKGGLALDTPEGLLEGGGDGAVIVAGDARDSELIRRIWLPESDDDHMPPEGRPQITVAEAELIRWWIDDGASMERTVAEAEPTETIAALFSSMGIDELPKGVFALSIAPPDSMAIRQLNELGLAVAPLSEGESLLQVGCGRRPDCLTADRIDLLRSISHAVTWLDLGSTDVGDAELEVLRTMPHLTRLHLENTNVTDAGLATLDGLEYLEYVNLYGTGVTDEGLSRLEPLRSLRSVYVWQTKVTQEGADRFVATRPDVRVNIGG